MSAASPARLLLQLKPLSTGELLDYAIKLYRDHFLLFFGIACVSQLIVFLVALAQGFYNSQNSPLGVLLFTIIWAFSYFVVTVLSQAATVFAVAEFYFERSISVIQAYRRAAPYLSRLIWLTIETGLRIGLASLLFLIPGIILTLQYSLIVPAAVLEDKRRGEAIARSSALTDGDKKRIFVIYLLFWVLSFVAGTAVGVVSASIPSFAHAIGPFWLRTFDLLGQFFSGAVVEPILTISTALLYFDLRVRKEGFDLQMMMQQLSGAEIGLPAPQGS